MAMFSMGSGHLEVAGVCMAFEREGGRERDLIIVTMYYGRQRQ